MNQAVQSEIFAGKILTYIFSLPSLNVYIILKIR